MVKKTPKMHCLYNGKMQPITEIYRQNRKRRGRSKYILSVEVSVIKDEDTIPARIIYVRKKNKKKDYLAIITTDMTISEEEAIAFTVNVGILRFSSKYANHTSSLAKSTILCLMMQ